MRGKIRPGETVLILGASGGVGTCCVQLAKQRRGDRHRLRLQRRKAGAAEGLGADIGINYTTTDWVAECHARFGRARTSRRDAGGIDVVVNFTGGETWTNSLRVLRRDGRLLTCGATAGYDPKEDIRYIWTFELNIVGSNGWSREDIEALLDLVKAGDSSPRCIRNASARTKRRGAAASRRSPGLRQSDRRTLTRRRRNRPGREKSAREKGTGSIDGHKDWIQYPMDLKATRTPGFAAGGEIVGATTR